MTLTVTEQAIIDFQRQKEALMARAKNFDPVAAGEHARPEYVRCISDTDARHIGKSWCGRLVAMEFTFVSADHAAANGRNKGRLVACRECVAAIMAGLKEGDDYHG